MTKSKGIRSRWTEQQLARIEALILEYQAAGHHSVPWSQYEGELGHHRKSIYQMSCLVRGRLRTKERAAYRAEVRAALKPLGTMAGVRLYPVSAQPAAKPSQPEPVAQKRPVVVPSPKLMLDSERVNTSTQKLAYAAEMMLRIGSQGITAGLLGDPPPGRSALDEKRGTKIEIATTCRRGTSRVPRLPSMPTRPIRL